LADSCWKTVGTQGDGSCPKLADLSHCRNCGDYVRAGRLLLDRQMPEPDRAEWTDLLAERKQAVGDTLSLMVFRVAGEWLALPVTALRQVVEERRTHVLPGRSNRAFRGLVNIDGELLLCFSAARMLGLEADGTPLRMLVASRGADRIVFSADEVLGALRVPRDRIGPPPATVKQGPFALTTALFHLEDRAVGLLDVDRWFACAARSLA
jgi:chemotaxis-related protein WspD